MGMQVSDSGGFTPAPAGTHVARCIGYVELGTQKVSYQGKDKAPQRKVRIMWELAEEKKDDGKPVITSKTYSAFLGDKASLRLHLQSWRGQPFTPVELKAFDLDNIVGKSCMLTIINEPKEGGGVRDSITAITPVHKSVTVPPQITPSVIFVIAPWDGAKYEALPIYLQNLILQSPEGAKARMNSSHGGGGMPPANDPDGVGGGEIPF